MKYNLRSLPSRAAACLFLVACLALFVPQAAGQDGTARLGGPSGQDLRERYTPEDYQNFLRRERSGQVPFQGGPVPATPGATDILVNNNTGATTTTNFTQSETSILAFGSTVVIGFNDAGSNAGGANKFTGWSYSTDGGTTFTDGGTLPTNAVGDAGDPVLARDETTGMLYFSTLGFNTPGNIQMFRSTDNGVSWLPPVNATPGGSTEDKQWHAVDNFPGAGNGNVYLISRRFGSTGFGPGIYLFRSTDQGASFGPTNGTFIVAGNQGAFVTVGSDHAVYAFWYTTGSIQVRKSTDFGATFGPAVTVASGLVGGTNGDLGLTGIRQGTATASGFRSNEFPHAAVNPASGHLYVTYNNDGAGADKADVFLVLSTDGGATWTTPLKVNDDATTTDQWQPTIAVTPDGTGLGIFYYSRQDDPGGNNIFRYYGRTAVIAGFNLTFTPSFAISDVASLPEFGRDAVVNSTYMGDYNHAVATPGWFHVVWSDNRDDLAGGAPRKDPNIYYERIPAGLLSGANISVAPSAVNFGGTPVGGTGGPVDIFLTNIGDATLTVNSISGPTGDFSATPPALPLVLPSATSVSFPVQFSPAGSGTQTSTITIGSDALNTPSATVDLSGRGYIPAANDLCTGAIAVNCGTTVDGNTDNASVDIVPACSGVVATAPGLWYTVAGTGAPITLATCSAASFDTRISVFSGSCGALVCVTANDDFCAPRSQVTFPSTDGVTYYVLVHGAGAQSGTFTLSVSACPALVSVNPPVLDFTIPPNGTGSAPLTIGNVAAPGALDLAWAVVANEAGPALAAGPAAANATPAEEPLFRVTDRAALSLRLRNVSSAFLQGLEGMRTAPALDKETFLERLAALPGATEDISIRNLILEYSAVMRSEIKDVPGAIGGKAALATAAGPSGPAPQGFGGPDGFGYKWVDSNEPGGPVFNWQDITSTGTPVTLGDDAGIQVPLGMVFPFYGVSHDSLRISSNGYLTFGTTATTFTNAGIPSSATPNDIICPFWDDLNPAAAGSGGIFYLATDSLFIVQYNGVYRFGTTTPETFQAILRPDGSMLFQYLDMQGLLTSATVGIENPGGTDGLQVAFNTAYVQNNLAVRIALPTPCTWITSVVPASGTILAGATQAPLVSVDATGLTAGSSYACEIVLLSNAANGARLVVPVNLQVSDASAPPVVSSPIIAGATSVSGTSTEADGTTIEVFVNSAPVGTTVVASNAWTKSGLSPLAAGDSVSARATAPGEFPSVLSNVVIVSPAAPSANVIENPGFETGTSPWRFFTNGTGSFSTVSPGATGAAAARVIITTTGSNMQLYQSGITLQSATLYRLTFKALSSSGRDLAVHLLRHDSPYTDYGLNGIVFDLSPSWQTFSVDFTTINFPPPSPSNARLRFRLNGFAAPGEVYYIDDVVLEALPGGGPVATQIVVETAANGTGSVVPAQTVNPGDSIRVYAIARDASSNFVGNVPATWSLLNITGAVVAGDLVPSGDGRSAWFHGNGAGTAEIQAASAGLTPVPSGTITVPTSPPATNLLVNGGFETGTAPWTFFTNGAGSFTTVVPGNVGTRAGQVSITTPGSVVQLYQRNISLTSGAMYRLSFKARSNTGHDVALSVLKHTSPFTPYGLPNTLFDLTSAWADFSVDFMASGFGGTVNDARVRFWLGPYDAAGDVYEFDDVRLEPLPSPAGGSSNAAVMTPVEFSLEPNFPNPFNPSTTIIYTLPVDARVTLEVYDILGRRVAQLVDGVKTAGYHDAVFDASDLSSGVYMYRMAAVGPDGQVFTSMQKMLLAK